MSRFRFSVRTALLSITVCSAIFAFGFTSTTHQVVATWDDHGVLASWQTYPGDRVDIIRPVGDEKKCVARNVEVIQFVQHGDLADIIVVRVSQFQKWKLSMESDLKWERVLLAD